MKEVYYIFTQFVNNKFILYDYLFVINKMAVVLSLKTNNYVVCIH